MVEVNELGVSLIISVPVLVILMILSKKFKYYSEAINIAEDLDAEISQMLNLFYHKHGK